MNILNVHILFYFYLIIIDASCKTVMLKFKELFDEKKTQNENLNNNDNDISIYSDLYDYDLYTMLNIGEPSQLMLGIFNPKSNVFEINSNEHCKNNNNYNYSYIKSLSSIMIRRDDGDYYNPGYLIINDSITIDILENNNKRAEKISDFQFKFIEYKSNPWGKEDTSDKIYCAELGFLINQEKKTWSKFINFLKEKNIIGSYKVTMNYTNNNEGYFYIGDFPHEYNQNNFKEFQLISAYAIPRSSFSQFRILMDDVYATINETNKYKISYNEVFFHFDLGLIECPVDYFNFIKSYFFKDYLNKSICELKTMAKNLNNYYMIICNENEAFSLKSFPPINFHHFELNKTFILDYNDLFFKENNKYYFQIIYSSFSGSYWKLGKPFLKKYQITLDLDSKKIYFYDNEKIGDDGIIEEKINNSLDLKDILLISFCSVLCICLVIVFIKLIKKNRKKRANELKDDDYEYGSLDANSENVGDNQIFK